MYKLKIFEETEKQADYSKDIILRIEHVESGQIGFFNIEDNNDSLEDVAVTITSIFYWTTYGVDIKNTAIGKELMEQEGFVIIRVK